MLRVLLDGLGSLQCRSQQLRVDGPCREARRFPREGHALRDQDSCVLNFCFDVFSVEIAEMVFGLSELFCEEGSVRVATGGQPHENNSRAPLTASSRRRSQQVGSSKRCFANTADDAANGGRTVLSASTCNVVRAAAVQNEQNPRMSEVNPAE